MKRLLITFCFVLFFSAMGYAHGTHFHSIEEMSAHISQHLLELEQLEQQYPADNAKIRKECQEITAHAQRYSEFAKGMMRDGRYTSLAKNLEMINSKLSIAATGADISAMVSLLRQMKSRLINFDVQ